MRRWKMISKRFGHEFPFGGEGSKCPSCNKGELHAEVYVLGKPVGNLRCNKCNKEYMCNFRNELMEVPEKPH